MTIPLHDLRDEVQFINGNWVNGLGAEFQSLNPAVSAAENVIWRGHSASSEQVDIAIQSARSAFQAWALTSYSDRLAIVKLFGELLLANKDRLAIAISKETGKPKWETLTEVAGMVGKIAISEKAFKERTGTVESEMAGSKAFIRHKPHGVVAVFGPYNFPGHLPNGHIIPALLAGNTVIFKPSELTPLVAQITAELWQKAGLPSGVLSLLQGEVETGKALAGHNGIDGLFFTGSSNTGHLLHKQYAGRPEKILALEMGGNNPLIVKDVESIDAAVHDILQSAFVTTGQRCTCTRRLFIENSKQGDAILERFVEVSKRIGIGAYDDENEPFLGPLVSEKAAIDLVNAQQKIKDLGGNILLELQHSRSNTGFVTPGIIDVTNAKPMPDEEYFGPLVKVYRYDNFDQALTEANNTSFGLSAAFLGKSESDYRHFFQTIRAGIVNWNRPTTGANSQAPFGGIGASGNHRASAYYAADYCAYPISSVENEKSILPENLNPGLAF